MLMLDGWGNNIDIWIVFYVTWNSHQIIFILSKKDFVHVNSAHYWEINLSPLNHSHNELALKGLSCTKFMYIANTDWWWLGHSAVATAAATTTATAANTRH